MVTKKFMLKDTVEVREQISHINDTIPCFINVNNLTSNILMLDICCREENLFLVNRKLNSYIFKGI